MWFNVIKALPDPDSIAGLLAVDSGREHLSKLAREDDKKNILKVRNKLKELAEGREIPEGSDIETVTRNAKILLDDLNEQITGGNKRAQTTLSKRLNTILEKKNKEGLVKFVGKSIKNMSSKTRKEKLALLKENEDRIREFIDEDDEDLFYTNNEDLTLFVNKADLDTEFDSKLERVKSRLNKYPLTFTETDNRIEIKLDKKTKYQDTIEILDVLGIIKAKQFKRKDTKTDLTNVLLFQKEGNYELSPLLKIFDIDKPQKEIKQTVESSKKKKYVNNVIGDEQVIGYLKFMTSRKIRTQLKFVPDTLISSGTSTKVRNELFGSPPILSVSLRTIFTRPTFDLSKLTSKSEEEKNKKYINLKIRQLLSTSGEIQGLDTAIVTDIRNKWKNAAHKNLKRFMSALNSEQKTTLNEYVSKRTITSGSVFSEEEVNFIQNLTGQPTSIRRELNSKFNKEIEAKGSIYRGIVKAKNILFKKTENGFILNRQTDSKVMKQSVYTEIVKVLERLKEGESTSVDENIKGSLTNYNHEFKPTLSGAYSPIEMVHFLYLLDLYYGRTGFRKTARKFKNKEIEVDELVEEAQNKFSDIKKAFTQQIKVKVDDILENRMKYQKGLTLKRGRGRTKGVRNIFTLLEENGVIKEA